MPFSRPPVHRDDARQPGPRDSGVRLFPTGLARVARASTPPSGRASRLPASGPGPHAEEDAAAERLSWTEICHRDDLRGRWVALDACEYEGTGERPSWATVVDVDDDLAELCARVRDSRWRHCAIHFCDDA